MAFSLRFGIKVISSCAVDFPTVITSYSIHYTKLYDLIPNRSEKAIKTNIYDEQGQYVFCRVWYSKGDKKTSPIMVHVEPQKNEQEEKKEVEDDLFPAS